jgi:hypothetical protein
MSGSVNPTAALRAANQTAKDREDLICAEPRGQLGELDSWASLLAASQQLEWHWRSAAQSCFVVPFATAAPVALDEPILSSEAGSSSRSCGPTTANDA